MTANEVHDHILKAITDYSLRHREIFKPVSRNSAYDCTEFIWETVDGKDIFYIKPIEMYHCKVIEKDY